MSPFVLARVIEEATASTREPTEQEWPAINDYVRRFVDEIGVPPMCDHDIPGLDVRVLFMQPRTTSLDGEATLA